jgi:hypothetical protein
MVEFFVGPEKKLFRLHKELVCTVSDVLSKMFNSGFLEGSTGCAYLPEDDV